MKYDAEIAELIESGEKNAQAKDAANGRLNPQDFFEPVEVGDPRRNGRDSWHKKSGSDRDRYSAEREENDRRRTRRSGDVDEDETMRDVSDKGSANGSVRSRRRSRSPGSDRRDRRSSRDRRYRERDPLDNGGDFYSGGGRRPTYTEDDYYRPSGRRDDRARDRDRERERSPRRRDDRRGDPRDRRRSPGPVRKAKTPEPTDDERDRRTVFVQQLAARLRTKELKGFFEQVGGVVDAQIVKDRVSGRSKGYVQG